MSILRKPFLAALLVLSLGCVACEGEPRPSANVRHVYVDSRYGVKCFCLNGYMYMTYSVDRGGGVTQMWEDGPTGPRPMHCPAPGEPAY